MLVAMFGVYFGIKFVALEEDCSLKFVVLPKAPFAC